MIEIYHILYYLSVYLDGVVAGAAGDQMVGGQMSDGEDGSVVADEHVDERERAHVVHVDVVVVGAAAVERVGERGHRVDHVGVIGEGVDELARLVVEDTRRVVERGARHIAVRQVGERRDGGIVVVEGPDEGARHRVPDAHGAVVGAARQPPVGQHEQVEHLERVATEREQARGAVRVPHLDGLVARAGDQIAGGEYARVEHLARVALHGRDPRAVERIPQDDVVVARAARQATGVGEPRLRQHRSLVHVQMIQEGEVVAGDERRRGRRLRRRGHRHTGRRAERVDGGRHGRARLRTGGGRRRGSGGGGRRRRACAVEGAGVGGIAAAIGPDAHGGVGRAGGETIVGQDGHGVDLADVAGEHLHLAARLTPQDGGGVDRAAGEQARRELDERDHAVLVAGECGLEQARRHVPDLDGVVGRAARQVVVGQQRQHVHAVRVIAQQIDLFGKTHTHTIINIFKFEN